MTGGAIGPCTFPGAWFVLDALRNVTKVAPPCKGTSGQSLCA